ncbi:hypothetical protein MESS2_1590083 [Mesorhizobium metallidurans STM 2683]|uniref:Insertion element IS402-like domain-containing protein n=1 Tax=Mesorhizobium metallidurans STM 2683 TaxID=1297569 RepID=M5F183_9HYPH|nr:hypothetical protein MESS2_1590083 [Mesorhizobium metallidurans STM 2683]
MWTDITRAKHARKGLRYSSDLTDMEWAVLEPVIPSPSRLGRPPKWSRREIMNGLFYVLRSGLPWRMLPRDLPPVSTLRATSTLGATAAFGARSITCCS